MVSRIIGKETTCVFQLLARLSISTTCHGIASSDDIRTTRLTCASSWSSGDLTGWARSMSKLWRDTCRSGKAQVHNEGGTERSRRCWMSKDGCTSLSTQQQWSANDVHGRQAREQVRAVINLVPQVQAKRQKLPTLQQRFGGCVLGTLARALTRIRYGCVEPRPLELPLILLGSSSRLLPISFLAAVTSLVPFPYTFFLCLDPHISVFCSAF